MKMIVVSVRDEKMEAFGRPFFVTSVGSAIRSFQDEVNRSADDNTMYKHSADFSLYELGTYDDFDAKFECGIPKLLIKGDQCKNNVSDIRDIKKNWAVV